jgi:hypothetical protein
MIGIRSLFYKRKGQGNINRSKRKRSIGFPGVMRACYTNGLFNVFRRYLVHKVFFLSLEKFIPAQPFGIISAYFVPFFINSAKKYLTY